MVFPKLTEITPDHYHSIVLKKICSSKRTRTVTSLAHTSRCEMDSEVGPRKDCGGPQIPTCSFTIQEIPQSYCLPCRAVWEQDLKYHLFSAWKLPKSHRLKLWSTEHCNSHPPLEQRLEEDTSIFLL